MSGNKSKFKPEITVNGFLAFIVISVLSIFLNVSCIALPDTFKEVKINNGNETQSNQTDAGASEVLPAQTIKIYIDNLIGYSSRNHILDGVNESIEAYNLLMAENNYDLADGEHERYLKYDGFLQVYDAQSADIIFRLVSGNDMALAIAGPFYYAAVTSFYSFVEDISWSDFKNYWNGTKTAFIDIEGSNIPMELVIGRSTFDIMEDILGRCSAQAFYILNSDDMKVAIQTGKIDIAAAGNNNLTGSANTDNLQENSIQEQTGQQVTEAVADQAHNDVGRQFISIIPFENIKPYQKVLKIDGKSPLDKIGELNSGKDREDTGNEGTGNSGTSNNIAGTGSDINTITDYPLICAIGAEFDNDVIENELEELIKNNLSKAIPSNRSDDDISSVIMTGVTALTRQVAAKMDEHGILYPAEKIQETLLDADITHISNEVSFVPDCYAARSNTTVFCSKPEYIELIKYIDADVIELTGNHMNDYGSKWLDYTIDIYDIEGIPYFGGGRNLEDALKPAVFEINGYKFAFIGANPNGPSFAWATDNSAGSAPINTLSEELKEKDMQRYEQIIKLLKSQGHIVIFTFQYFEYESYSPTVQQVMDFERMINAGADIVSGSQSHVPQGVKILDNGFINFGLGNLFFGQKPRDTLLALKVKQGIIAKHIFYKGSHINTELITTFIEDFSQPRLMTELERADLLKSVFGGSKK